MAKEEFTRAELEQLDLIDGIAYQAVCDLAGEQLEWDIEWIGQVSELLAEIVCKLTGKSEMEVYPYFEDEVE